MGKDETRNKVIIVDDDEDLLRLLTFAFTAKGFDVHGLSNGKEALAYLLEEKNLQGACLLVLDRILPDVDGLDILKKLRTRPFSFPVLILSTLSSEQDVVSGLKEGAVDYITKPFSLPVLMQKALSLINRNSSN
jgi:two-component system phosphate regulon response regulator PhoB